jgi:hypothetical protein
MKSNGSEGAPLELRGLQSRHPIKVIFRRAVFDCDVLRLDEACFLEALAERSYQVRGVGERGAPEEPDRRHRGLLGARRERPDRRAAE